jgi:hypothetical protein
VLLNVAFVSVARCSDTPRFFNVTPRELLFAIEAVSRRLRAALPPGVRVFPALGNHDVYPFNVFLPHNETSNAILQNVADIFEQFGFLSAGELSQFRFAGFYSVMVQPTLQLIALNTNLWSMDNLYVQNLTDPGGQLLWLHQQLEASLRAGTRSLLIGHIPPGSFRALDD